MHHESGGSGDGDSGACVFLFVVLPGSLWYDLQRAAANIRARHVLAVSAAQRVTGAADAQHRSYVAGPACATKERNKHIGSVLIEWIFTTRANYHMPFKLYAAGQET